MAKSQVTIVYEAFGSGGWCRSSGMNHTWEKEHETTTSFWFLIIRSGFDFTKTDLVDNDVFCNEGHYSLAVRCGCVCFVFCFYWIC